MDDIKFTLLTEEEFKELDAAAKWNYIEMLVKQLYEFKVMADHNCDECMYRLQTSRDVNVDLFFDDWRECAENCDNCGKEELVNMCSTQYQVLNHLANLVFEIQVKQNRLVQFLYKRDPKGQEILEEMKKAKEEAQKRDKHADDMFL
jgi:hypothetical protein